MRIKISMFPTTATGAVTIFIISVVIFVAMKVEDNFGGRFLKHQSRGAFCFDLLIVRF